MQNNFTELLKTDNSSSTNLRYDIVVSKIMTSVKNHKRYQPRKTNTAIVSMLLEGFVYLMVAVLIFIFLIGKWIYKRL